MKLVETVMFTSFGLQLLIRLAIRDFTDYKFQIKRLKGLFSILIVNTCYFCQIWNCLFKVFNHSLSISFTVTIYIDRKSMSRARNSWNSTLLLLSNKRKLMSKFSNVQPLFVLSVLKVDSFFGSLLHASINLLLFVMSKFF
jgi:hypothetical protein